MRECACLECAAWHCPLPFDDDCGENSEPIAFSRTPCPGKGHECHLAGERYIEHTLEEDGSLSHVELCPECFLAWHGLAEEAPEGDA